MKVVLILSSLIGSAALAAGSVSSTPAEVISHYARACHAEVGIQISIGLSQAVHMAKPGSAAEKSAQKKLDLFNKNLESFPSFEMGCNEGHEGDARFTCYSQGYARETLRIVRAAKATDVKRSVPECAYLDAAR